MMDIFDAMDLDSAMEDMQASMERSNILNRHNITALGDNLTRKEFFITFDGKTKKTVKFSKSFIGALEEFMKRECSQGKPEPVNRWRSLPGHMKFKNQAWYNKNKDRAVYVWTYWSVAGFIATLVINPVLMQALDPIDFRMKEEERTVDSRCSMHKSSLYNVIHKGNALLTM